MEALKLIQTTEDGILHIEVPDHFRNTELEVIVKPLAENQDEEKKTHSIRSFFGTAKYPDTKVSKYDAYNQ